MNVARLGVVSINPNDFNTYRLFCSWFYMNLKPYTTHVYESMYWHTLDTGA